MASKLDQIGKDLDYLKKAVRKIQLYLEDSFLTPEEEKIVEKGDKEFKEGKTTSLKKLEKHA